MKDISKVIIISDLHIGGDNEVKSLDKIIDFLCDDKMFTDASLVVAGDMLDSWSHDAKKVPPSYKQIIKNNSFWNALSKRAEKTPVYYLNGNHDFDLSIANLDEKSRINQVKPEELFTRFNGELYIDHGNCVDLFNAKGHSDDGRIPYPLGYFKTRLHHIPNTVGSDIPMQTDLYLNNAKSEVIRILYSMDGKKLNQESELDELLESISKILLDGMKKDIESNFMVDLRELECKMPQGYSVKSYNYEEILNNYIGFVSRFYHNHLIPSLGEGYRNSLNVPWKAFANSIDVVRTGGLSWYASQVASNKNSVLAVVFGHTHMNQIQKLPATNDNGKKLLYGNSGCWCKNTLGPNVTSITYDLDNLKLISKNQTITL